MSNEKILVVEDEWIIAKQICGNLKDFGYEVGPTASTGEEAVRMAETERPDLILMDVVLNGKMDGIDAVEKIALRFDIPIIYLTAHTNQEYLKRAKQTKPFGYLVKPFKEQELYANIEMALYKHKTDKAIKDYLNRHLKCYKETIAAVSGAIELRGPWSVGHHRRVAELAQAIAREMNLADLWLDGLRLAAHVYDISFMNMPDDIIQESGQLTGSKLTMYRNYPQLSYDILKEVDFPSPVAYIVLEHRECFDGSGFPQGLRGAEIVLEARILAVADAIEDLTCERTFRNAFPLREALEEVSSHSGSRYDPNVVAACLSLFHEKGYKMSG